MDNKIKESRTEEIYSYAGIWNMPLKIYAIEKTKLIVPISLWDAVFYLIAVLTMLILGNVFPPIKNAPLTIKFLLLPFVFMKFVSLVKLEGKQPHKYFWDMLIFFIFPKKYEHFKSSEKKITKIDFTKEKIYFIGKDK